MMRNWGLGPTGSHKDTLHYYKFKGAMCLIFTCCSSLTLLILDTDAKHSQDVGRLKPLHGLNFLIEHRPHLPAWGEHVYVDNEYGTAMALHIFIHTNTQGYVQIRRLSSKLTVVEEVLWSFTADAPGYELQGSSAPLQKTWAPLKTWFLFYINHHGSCKNLCCYWCMIHTWGWLITNSLQ